MKHEQAGNAQQGEGENVVENAKLVGFYLGEDDFHDLNKNLPVLAADLDKLQNDGLDVDGIHVNILLFLGGDLKFLNSMLGLTNNASLYPCPFCMVFKGHLSWTLAELQDPNVRNCEKLQSR